MAGGLSPTTPIQPRALLVTDGRIVHVIDANDGGVSGHKAVGGIGSLSAPDGTYLRLDYVTDVIKGYADQVKGGGTSKTTTAAQALEALEQFFKMRPL